MTSVVPSSGGCPISRRPGAAALLHADRSLAGSLLVECGMRLDEVRAEVAAVLAGEDDPS